MSKSSPLSTNQGVKRFAENPLLKPEDIKPSEKHLNVECLLNPGAFVYDDKIWLLLRVAEAAQQSEKYIRIPVFKNGNIEIMELDRNIPDIDASDPRVIIYEGKAYLTTLSHFRLAYSIDGKNFKVTDKYIIGHGELEAYGIEDCRVTQLEDTYFLTYTAVSECGYGVNMTSTTDWENFDRYGMIISGPNKDCAIFQEKIGGKYFCLHRPTMGKLGGNHIWLADSDDLVHWGNHKCIAKTRPGMWDNERIGAGAAPIKTEKGWLEIYHSADNNSRYCLGAILLDLNDPSKVIARSKEPIMQPVMDYEKKGFFGNVIFTNGHIVNGDSIWLYYGASDTVICGAELSISQILASLSI